MLLQFGDALVSHVQLTLGDQKQLDQPKRGDSSLAQVVLKLLDGIHGGSITDPAKRENIGFTDLTATFGGYFFSGGPAGIRPLPGLPSGAGGFAAGVCFASG